MTDYEKLVNRIRETVEAKLPRGSTVAVASRGDDELLALGAQTTRPLPTADDGSFLGGHPADSQDAIRHLECARENGAGYFLLPAPQFWWRDYYREFQAYLEQNHELLWNGGDCIIYKLLKPQPSVAETCMDLIPNSPSSRSSQSVPARMCPEMISRLRWEADRLLLDDLVFRLEHKKNEQWELGDQCFGFYKVKDLIDAYVHFWNSRPHTSVRNILELGIWDGGSSAFWFEFFNPDKLIAVDWSQKEDTAYFKRYQRTRRLEERVRTYWGVNQADRARLSSIVNAEFQRPLDLVIDDASHIYGPTRSSFEVLFPRLRPGGLYIIEDWAWDHWPEFHRANSVFANERRLTDFVWDVTEAIGTRGGLISNMTVCHGFVAIERGWKELAETGFDLEKHIIRRSPKPVGARHACEPT